MILVDTSIWIDHLDKANPIMQELLKEQRILMHPFVLGEIAMGSLRKREFVLSVLSAFESAPLAREDEVLSFVRAYRLFGKGIGYIDAHILTSAKLAPGTQLWTRDKRLQALAAALSIDYKPLLN
jgi:predicted nucleic acid-binding protein